MIRTEPPAEETGCETSPLRAVGYERLRREHEANRSRLAALRRTGVGDPLLAVLEARLAWNDGVLAQLQPGCPAR